MKRLTLLLATAIICLSVTAQEKNKKDTIRIGGMIIVKDGRASSKNKKERKENDPPKKPSRVSTNWGILDLGFSNYNDNTNYALVGPSYIKDRPGSPAIGKPDLKLRTGKSINVNIWFFMQRINLVKHNVNLKYGFGLELNNYRYKSTAMLSYREGGTIPYSGGLQTNSPFIFRDSISFSKNKLAADYVTVPMMLNFASHANQKKGVSLSVGVSAGYLYSQRNKQVSNERGKHRNKGDYDLERFKFSYIAELGLGPVRLYGSYSPKSMYTKSLDIKPYTVGLRFSNW